MSPDPIKYPLLAKVHGLSGQERDTFMEGLSEDDKEVLFQEILRWEPAVAEVLTRISEAFSALVPRIAPLIQEFATAFEELEKKGESHGYPEGNVGHQAIDLQV